MDMRRMKIFILTFILCMSYFFTSFSAPVATSSDAGVFEPAFLDSVSRVAVSDITVSERVNGSWKTISRDSQLKYWTSSGADRVRIKISGSAVVGFLNFLTISDSSFNNISGDPAFYVDFSDGRSRVVSSSWEYLNFYNDRYGFGVTTQSHSVDYVFLEFDCSGSVGFEFTNFPLSDISGSSSYGRVSLNGVYTESDGKAYAQVSQSPGSGILSVTNYGSVVGVPTFSSTTNQGWNFIRLSDSDGILREGYEYKFQFRLRSSGFVRGTLRYNNSTSFDSDFSFKVLSQSVGSNGEGDYILQWIINPRFDMNLNLISFCFLQDNNILYSWQFDKSSSSYIPASDTGGMQQNINNVVTQISTTVQNIQNTITNISNQITNAVTNITNQIKDQTTQLVQNQDKNTDKVIQNQDENTDKITQNQDENTDKINENLNTEFDDLKNDYDNSSMTSDQERLDEALNEYDKVESELFDDAKDHISGFEFEENLDKYTGPLQDIAYFLSGIYSGLGALNIPIGFSLTLTIALLFIGYYRFKGGG